MAGEDFEYKETFSGTTETSAVLLNYDESNWKKVKDNKTASGNDVGDDTDEDLKKPT